MQTENRHAVLRKIRSKCSSSEISLPELFHLQQFALDHLLGEFDQRVENAEVALLHRDLEGLHVEPVAGQHALGISPVRVGRRAPAPGLGLVDDVVVHQRGGVNDLDHRAQPDGAPSPGS